MNDHRRIDPGPMSFYERLASRLIGTPLQRPAEWLRHAKGAPYRRAHPELGEVFAEEGRIDRAMRRVIGRDTNCIDIGCHVGAYLQKILTLAPDGRHVAVEPLPHKAAWLRRKFPRVTVLDVALDEAEGIKDFFVDPARTSLSSLEGKAAGRQPIRVRCSALDDLVDDRTTIGFVKLDVHAGELRVLRGARRLLRRDRPFVLLGCTADGLADQGLSPDAVFAFVADELRYRVFLLKDYLANGDPLDAARFRSSMSYPFQAFNYALVPAA